MPWLATVRTRKPLCSVIRNVEWIYMVGVYRQPDDIRSNRNKTEKGQWVSWVWNGWQCFVRSETRDDALVVDVSASSNRLTDGGCAAAG